MNANQKREIARDLQNSDPVWLSGVLCVVEEIEPEGDLIVSTLSDGEMHRISTDAQWHQVFI